MRAEAMAAYTRSVLEPVVAALERSQDHARELERENGRLMAELDVAADETITLKVRESKLLAEMDTLKAAQTPVVAQPASEPMPAPSGATYTSLASSLAGGTRPACRGAVYRAAGVAPVTVIRPGARVRVQIPRSLPCHLHCLDSVPVLEAVGTVDRIEAAWDHPVVVVFDLSHLGTRGWMGSRVTNWWRSARRNDHERPTQSPSPPPLSPLLPSLPPSLWCSRDVKLFRKSHTTYAITMSASVPPTSQASIVPPGVTHVYSQRPAAAHSGLLERGSYLRGRAGRVLVARGGSCPMPSYARLRRARSGQLQRRRRPPVRCE